MSRANRSRFYGSPCRYEYLFIVEIDLCEEYEESDVVFNVLNTINDVCLDWL